MRAAKNIDELFAEVRSYDLVLTNDAPLATALNAKLDRPLIGGFAYTPRQIAAREQVHVLGRSTVTDLQLIAAIADETGYDLKFVHSEVQNIRQVRTYTADVERYLYTKKSRNVYRSFLNQPTLERIMAAFEPEKCEFFSGKKVAVVGVELFDDLDKHFVPLAHDDIELFKPGRNYELDTIYAVGNNRQIADSVVDLITADRTTDTAIVMDSEGAIADAVRAALYRRKIPFKNSLTVRDLSQVRDFLQFLTLAVGFETVRVGDVRELFASYGAREKYEFSGRTDGYLLSRVRLGDRPDPATANLIETMRTVGQLTFGETAQRVTAQSPRQRPALILLLEDLRLTDTPVTPALVNTVAYAVNNISDLRQNEQIPDEEKRGVLLADCHRSVFVDRPFVIYLGLDDAWADRSTFGKDYIDPEDEEERAAARLTVLLQQGTARVYAVRPVTNGRETVPCPVFERAEKDAGTPRETDRFEKLCSHLLRGTWHPDRPNERPEHGDFSIDTAADLDWQFSKSSYDRFAECPRAFLFGDLLDTPDSDKSAFGDCLHEFAELYLCYPALVKEKGLDHYLDELDRVYSGLSSVCLRETDRSRFRVCLENLMRYIDLVRPASVPLDRDNSKRDYPNLLMAAEGQTRYSSLTEIDLKSNLHRIHGKFDLLSGYAVVDYKSGNPKSLGEIQKGLDPQRIGYKEYQPLIYLALLQEHLQKQRVAGQDVSFKLLYVTDNLVSSATDPAFDITANTRTIRLTDRDRKSLLFGPEDSFLSRKTEKKYSELTGTHRAEFVAAVEKVETANGRPCTEADAEAVLKLMPGVKQNKTSLGAVGNLLKFSEEQWQTGYLPAGSNELILPTSRLNDFLEQVDRDHDAASALRQRSMYREQLVPKLECKDCAFFKACTGHEADSNPEPPEEGE